MDKRKTNNPKDKVLQIRCTQDFLHSVDELRGAFGMNRTELIEYLVQYIPSLASQQAESTK
jgi:hypothetical protein